MNQHHNRCISHRPLISAILTFTTFVTNLPSITPTQRWVGPRHSFTSSVLVRLHIIRRCYVAPERFTVRYASTHLRTESCSFCPRSGKLHLNSLKIYAYPPPQQFTGTPHPISNSTTRILPPINSADRKLEGNSPTMSRNRITSSSTEGPYNPNLEVRRWEEENSLAIDSIKKEIAEMTSHKKSFFLYFSEKL